MALKNLLKNVVGAVAPTLGTALGGLWGGMAANMIADAFGLPKQSKSNRTGGAKCNPRANASFKKKQSRILSSK